MSLNHWLLLFTLVWAILAVIVMVYQQRAIERLVRARNDLVQGLVNTVEYVGTDVLPPIKGWSWYDTLLKYDPERIAFIGDNPGRHSSLITHAQHELELIREDEDTIQKLLRVLRCWDDMGHSGGSHEAVLPVLVKLLNRENLAAISSDPDEWVHHDEDTWGAPGGIWQNKRNSKFLSTDAGKTYYSVYDDWDIDANKPTRIYKSAEFVSEEAQRGF